MGSTTASAFFISFSCFDFIGNDISNDTSLALSPSGPSSSSHSMSFLRGLISTPVSGITTSLGLVARLAVEVLELGVRGVLDRGVLGALVLGFGFGDTERAKIDRLVCTCIGDFIFSEIGVFILLLLVVVAVDKPVLDAEFGLTEEEGE